MHIFSMPNKTGWRVGLTESLSSRVGSLGMILVQSTPMRKTVTPVSFASLSSVSGSDQNRSLSSLTQIFNPQKSVVQVNKKNFMSHPPETKAPAQMHKKQSSTHQIIETPYRFELTGEEHCAMQPHCDCDQYLEPPLPFPLPLPLSLQCNSQNL